MNIISDYYNQLNLLSKTINAESLMKIICEIFRREGDDIYYDCWKAEDKNNKLWSVDNKENVYDISNYNLLPSFVRNIYTMILLESRGYECQGLWFSSDPTGLNIEMQERKFGTFYTVKLIMSEHCTEKEIKYIDSISMQILEN